MGIFTVIPSPFSKLFGSKAAIPSSSAHSIAVFLENAISQLSLPCFDRVLLLISSFVIGDLVAINKE